MRNQLNGKEWFVHKDIDCKDIILVYKFKSEKISKKCSSKEKFFYIFFLDLIASCSNVKASNSKAH